MITGLAAQRGSRTRQALLSPPTLVHRRFLEACSSTKVRLLHAQTCDCCSAAAATVQDNHFVMLVPVVSSCMDVRQGSTYCAGWPVPHSGFELSRGTSFTDGTTGTSLAGGSESHSEQSIQVGIGLLPGQCLTDPVFWVTIAPFPSFAMSRRQARVACLDSGWFAAEACLLETHVSLCKGAYKCLRLEGLTAAVWHAGLAERLLPTLACLGGSFGLFDPQQLCSRSACCTRPGGHVAAV